MKFTFIVEVESDTDDHATQVISERVDYNEQYTDEQGAEFAYTIDWKPLHKVNALWLTPEALRGAYEDVDDDPTDGLSDEQLQQVGEGILTHDLFYDTYRNLLAQELEGARRG